MKSIAFFNNKGGVGKTTLLTNLSGYLGIDAQKKILIVDADPQCNSTQQLFSDAEIDSIYAKDEFTINTIISPLAKGKGYSSEIKARRSENFQVDVVPGDPRLAINEDLLATDWSAAKSGDMRGLRTTFAFSKLLQSCAEYDYVLYDMGPSLGAINRAVLVSADYFVMPMSIDIFSLRAMENISTSIGEWERLLKRGLEDAGNLEDLEIDNPTWKLQFAGYVTQQYTAKSKQGDRRPVKAYENIMQDIPRRIEDFFLRDLNQEALAGFSPNLGTIPTFNSLVPMSQSARKPIAELKAADGVVGAHFQKVKEFHEIVTDIGEALEANVEALGS